MDRSFINNYKNNNDRLLISKIIDKIRFCETKNKIQSTDFLDLSEQKLVENFLKSQKIKNYFYCGCFEQAERKFILFYPEKLCDFDIKSRININDFANVIRITLPDQIQGEYSHRNYLGGLMKLGIERSKIGDIIVDDKGADIIVSPEITKFLLNSLIELKRFSKSRIELINIENLRQVDIKTEIIKITVSSMRLDSIVSELAKCSRGKANEILDQERVLVNHEIFTKPSKEIKENDIITIRGKGRFIIKDIVGNTRKGRLFIQIERFI